MSPKGSYKAKGEQIDGSFFWQGQTFLLEAKWTQEAIPASSIYSFKGKLDGKFHTTSGIFISVGGFSEDAELALKFGKTLNILLFDGNDVELLFKGHVDFVDMLIFKLREAGDTGSLYVPYNTKAIASKLSTSQAEPSINYSETEARLIPSIEDILVFVEHIDSIYVAKDLMETFRSTCDISYRITSFQESITLASLPSLISAYERFGSAKGVIIILEEDFNSEITKGKLDNITEQFENSSIPITPLFLFLNPIDVTQGQNNLRSLWMSNDKILAMLNDYITVIAEDQYNPYPEPEKIIASRLQDLYWDYERQEVDAPSDYDDFPHTLETLDDLIEYLNDEIAAVMNAEMPLEWLKDQDGLNYKMMIKQYLIENYQPHLRKLGWTEIF